MKPYRNIYLKCDEEYAKVKMTGTLEIPYTGVIFYDTILPDNEYPDGFDVENDIYYRCNCELEEFKEFKKIQ